MKTIKVSGIFGSVVWTLPDSDTRLFEQKNAAFQAKTRSWWHGSMRVFFSALLVPLRINSSRKAAQFMADEDAVRSQTLELIEVYSSD